MAAHSRVESGEKSAQSIAGALAMLMLRGERMEERLCLGMGLPASPHSGATGAAGKAGEVEATVRRALDMGAESGGRNHMPTMTDEPRVESAEETGSDEASEQEEDEEET